LRQAILDANANGGGEIIFSNTTGTIRLSAALPEINANLSITGPGSDQLTISGNNRAGIFTINRGITTTLSGLTIADGQATNAYGAGIANAGALQVINCSVINNQIIDGLGGGIYNCGDLALINSILRGNRVMGASGTNGVDGPGGHGGPALGGGIFSDFGTVLIRNGTLDANQTLGGWGGNGSGSFEGGAGGGAEGGAIFAAGGAVIIDHTAISHNTAAGGFGGQGGSSGISVALSGQPGYASGGAVFA